MRILIIGLVILVGWLFAADQNIPIPKPRQITPEINSSVSPTPVATLTPTSAPTTKPQAGSSLNQNTNNSSIGTIDCIGPDGKQFSASMDECKKLNEKWGKSVDYMLNCNIHQDCGGGTVRMSKSQCDKPCSGLPDKSDNVQVNNAPNNQQSNSNEVAVFLSYKGYTIYCPAQNASAVQSINLIMENKKTEWAKKYYECTDTLYKTDSCFVSCKKIMETDWNTCLAVYGYSGDNYSICTKEASNNYSSCISKCPSVSQTCEWVYSEQKDLASQINNLCN